MERKNERENNWLSSLWKEQGKEKVEEEVMAVKFMENEAMKEKGINFVPL